MTTKPVVEIVAEVMLDYPITHEHQPGLWITDPARMIDNGSGA